MSRFLGSHATSNYMGLKGPTFNDRPQISTLPVQAPAICPSDGASKVFVLSPRSRNPSWRAPLSKKTPNYRFERNERQRRQAEKQAKRDERRLERRKQPGDPDVAVPPGDGGEEIKSE